MSIRLHIDRSQLAAFCRKWQVKEISAFGSVLREDFDSNSDVDLLITFADGATPSLFDLAAMAGELEAFLGRSVDLMTRRGVEQSANPYRRAEILATAELLYAA